MAVDLESLRVLIAVVDTGSFAKAAEQLHKTQSSVSYQVNKLEQQLGTQVFDRSSYRAELTPVGLRILEEGRRLLHQADYVGRLVEHFSEGWEPKLELVVDGMLPTEPVLRVLKEMIDLEIPTRIQFRIEFLGGVQQRFEQQPADLMLVLDYQADPAFSARSLKELEAVLVVSRDHPLAMRQQLDTSELHAHVELTVHDSSYSSAYGGLQTFGGERVFYLSDFRTKKEALLQGLGFGWMPIEQIRQEIRSGALQEVDYQGGSRYSYSPLLVFRKNEPLGRAGTLLQEKLQKVFG
ncbi:LysR family transcriptional regulator [Neptunomonas antarctica]|uniref:Transcriptional regulator, LysR family n=1 Tax=Neptunomonas antarctica TaxID=619304 RepID=A0A1N7K1J3_9GAMM|nr:LysR family transcriptional regulator [Neptunomonas antarctica]SIS55431.1 transcriptional regulator, LysR family [Neptunomonas antarctica]